MTNKPSTVLKKVILKDEMTEKTITTTLDEAFKNALAMSEGCASEQERFEAELLLFIEQHPNVLSAIKEEYKLEVIKSWDYEIVSC